MIQHKKISISIALWNENIVQKDIYDETFFPYIVLYSNFVFLKLFVSRVSKDSHEFPYRGTHLNVGTGMFNVVQKEF